MTALRTGQPCLDVMMGVRSPRLNQHRWILVQAVPLVDPATRIPREVVSSFLDVTGREQVVHHLRESEGAYRTLASNLPCLVYRFIPNRGVVEFGNDMLSVLTGYVDDEVTPEGGCALAFGIHPEDRGRVLESIDQAVGEMKPYQVEYRFHHKQSGTRYFSERARPVAHDDGTLASVVGVVFDVTESKVRDDEKRRLEWQMQRTQKLESLGVLAGGLAHDFNNMLTGILGNAELVLMELPAVSPLRSGLEEIRKTSLRASELTRQLLAYAGKGRFVVRPVDINRVIRDTRRLLSVSASARIQLELELAPDLPRVVADAAQLQQILVNLVTNASEAIGEQAGTIRVVTRVVESDRPIAATGALAIDAPPGLYVALSVHDDGCGMDNHTLERIFDPFFTTKFTGRGLGLPAVEGIVRAHSGAIEVTSTPAKGSTFTVLFPAEKGPEPVSSSPGRKNGTDAKQAPTVLVVDDEETVRAVARGMLERQGFRVLTAVDGRHAIEVFCEQMNEIDVVVLDATMPRLDGEQTFRALRKAREDLPVILSSGHDESEVASKLENEGLAGFLAKPYEMKALTDKVREALAKRPKRSRAPSKKP